VRMLEGMGLSDVLGLHPDEASARASFGA